MRNESSPAISIKSAVSQRTRAISLFSIPSTRFPILAWGRRPRRVHADTKPARAARGISEITPGIRAALLMCVDGGNQVRDTRRQLKYFQALAALFVAAGEGLAQETRP